jgi:hypothetical protein
MAEAAQACLVRAGAGCAWSAAHVMGTFRHPEDTLSYRNETVWSYALDPATGRQVHQRREPPPEYTLRCFVLARVVKQFHLHARFDPDGTPLAEAETLRRVRHLLTRDARSRCLETDRIVFPGFAHLRDFSRAHEAVLKREAGGAWQSYFQRGHWRMLFPFSRASQAREAARLVAAVRADTAPVLHVFTIPQLTVNHAIVLFDVSETAAEFRFRAYDPNAPDDVLEPVFNRERREFWLPPTAYFIGGWVRAYEVYCSLWR